MSSIVLIVEDKNKNAISLGLYNQSGEFKQFKDLVKTFPEGTRIGIKQPYLKLSFSGTLYLRNDNPENIIFL